MKKIMYFIFCFYIFALPLKALEGDDDSFRPSGQVVLFAKKDIQVPSEFEVEKRPGDVLVIRTSLVDFHKYPSLSLARTVAEYMSISRAKEALIKDADVFPGQLNKLYAAIRELGTINSQADPAERFVGMIQSVVDRVPVSNPENVYRLVRSSDRQQWRLCIEANDEVVLVLVPGSKKLEPKEKVRERGKRTAVTEEDKDAAVASSSYRLFPPFFYTAGDYFRSTRLFQMFYRPLSRCSWFSYFRHFSHHNHK